MRKERAASLRTLICVVQQEKEFQMAQHDSVCVCVCMCVYNASELVLKTILGRT